jgi:carbamoyl-phosphate synthase small subunit
VQAEGVVMRDVRPEFAAWLRDRGVVALTGIDTRTLVRKIRDGGVLRCALGEAPIEELRQRALDEPYIDGRPLARQPGAQQPFSVGAGPRVVVVDLGSKRSIPQRLAHAGLEAYVVPGSWDADAILESDPRVVLIANGPGDPAVLTDQVETIQNLLGQVPLFGVCLGHQLLGLALGHDTFKLPFGHRGANHPVRDVKTGRVLVTVQNHGFAVLANGDISHVSLNDGTCEGLIGDGFESVQFHPEASPGPLDALPFFDRLADACRSAPTFARS